ncbi:N-acetylneuraminate synthase [Candidatus Puniceispirillum sp.]|nr:N-acetylneuraminate synthase [Alphaproteobacteria bacterium]MDC1293905.1 N-acetylneuraminate synthase [Candidatus Puniceispirillum sp.]
MSAFYKSITEPNSNCYFIAEAGVNHNGNVKTALQLIDVACQADADAVKFQTFKPEHLVTKTAPAANYQIENMHEQASQYDMLAAIQLKYESHAELQSHCKDKSIDFLSTPFEEDSADFLNDIGLPAFKIPSGELTNIPFLKHVASKGKPMILSTGMGSLSEVESAIASIENAGLSEIIILHCVSQYPAPYADVNLRAMETLKHAFGYPVGFSDHTEGTEVAIAALSLGACVIEKHFTLNKLMDGPDHKASLEPDELISLVRSIRNVECAMGDGRKVMKPSEINTADVARKSIVAKEFIMAGDKITLDMLAIKRPGTGVDPSFIHLLLGRRVRFDIVKDQQITMGMFD